MKIDSPLLPLLPLGRRVFRSGLVLTTTLIACTALQANEQVDKDKTYPDKQQAAGKEHAYSTEKFVQKALACGKMEVQAAQLAEQQGQSPEVKVLAAAIVRDHAKVNQRLQQIATSKNISQTAQGPDHQKAQEHLDKLKSQSGAEFDKEFVRMALKGHKKEINEFQKAQAHVADAELKAFIGETLPTLRQHYDMAKALAPTVGVDEATIAAEVDKEESAIGGAAPAETGRREKGLLPELQSPDRPRSSLDQFNSDNSAAGGAPSAESGSVKKDQ